MQNKKVYKLTVSYPEFEGGSLQWKPSHKGKQCSRHHKPFKLEREASLHCTSQLSTALHKTCTNLHTQPCTHLTQICTTVYNLTQICTTVYNFAQVKLIQPCTHLAQPCTHLAQICTTLYNFAQFKLIQPCTQSRIARVKTSFLHMLLHWCVCSNFFWNAQSTSVDQCDHIVHVIILDKCWLGGIESTPDFSLTSRSPHTGANAFVTAWKNHEAVYYVSVRVCLLRCCQHSGKGITLAPLYEFCQIVSEMSFWQKFCVFPMAIYRVIFFSHWYPTLKFQVQTS